MDARFPPGTRVRIRSRLGALEAPQSLRFRRVVEPGEVGVVVEDAQPYGWVMVRVGDVYVPTLPTHLEEEGT